MTLIILEDYLVKFNGCVIIVSHDRYFMDKVVDHLFVFEGNGIVKDFPGNYSIYRDSVRIKQENQNKKIPKEKKIGILDSLINSAMEQYYNVEVQARIAVKIKNKQQDDVEPSTEGDGLKPAP